jgi:NAD+ kinase
MSDTHRVAALFGSPNDERVVAQMRAAAQHLTEAGLRVIAAVEAHPSLEVERLSEAELPHAADLFVAIGGDGTMLYAARVAVGHDVPLLGINRGRLGFLTDVRPEEMSDSLNAVLRDDVTRESRLLLEARVMRGDQLIASSLALNDVVLGRRETGRMVDFETRVNGVFVNSHAGDGMIAATPTGSTAYALSCGGPIIHPTLDAIALVPVCPHTLSDRPVVLPASAEIEIHLTDRPQTNGEISCDGQFLCDLGAEDQLTIRAAAERITLIHPPGHDYFELLRSKLNWGKDSRRRVTRAGD